MECGFWFSTTYQIRHPESLIRDPAFSRNLPLHSEAACIVVSINHQSKVTQPPCSLSLHYQHGSEDPTHMSVKVILDPPSLDLLTPVLLLFEQLCIRGILLFLRSGLIVSFSHHTLLTLSCFAFSNRALGITRNFLFAPTHNSGCTSSDGITWVSARFKSLHVHDT